MEKAKVALGEIQKRIHGDPEFRKRFFADPDGVLTKEYGVVLPPGQKIRIVEDSPTVRHFVVACLPRDAHPMSLSEKDLEGIVGGVGVPLNHGGSSPTSTSPTTTKF